MGFRHDPRPVPRADQAVQAPANEALAEELWFPGGGGSLPASPIHKNILDERWTAYKAGRMKRIILPELERRLARW